MRYGINTGQLRMHIVRPVLRYLGLHSDAAENLVLGTALVESQANALVQFGGGPALGLWQMEPATHDDIFDNFLRYNQALRLKVSQLSTPAEITSGAHELIGNLFYGAALCRLHYLRVKQPLPEATDVIGMAAYWKLYYNTLRGAGDVQHAVPHFEVACGYVRRQQ